MDPSLENSHEKTSLEIQKPVRFQAYSNGVTLGSIAGDPLYEGFASDPPCGDFDKEEPGFKEDERGGNSFSQN